MTSGQARDDAIAASATRSTRYPWERVRAETGGAGGAVPAAAPAALKSVARPSAFSFAWFAQRRRAAGDERPEGNVGRTASRWQMAELQSYCAWSFLPGLPCSSADSRAGHARSRVFVTANPRNRAS